MELKPIIKIVNKSEQTNKNCHHEWVSAYEQYCGGLRYITKCSKCGAIKL